MNKLLCELNHRREQVRLQSELHGLDYLEVGDVAASQATTESLLQQTFLRVVFLGKAPQDLTRDHIVIEGGRRIRDIRVVDVTLQHYQSADLDDQMLVKVDRAGDFSTYTLRMVEQDEDGKWQSHSAFDPRYDRLQFSFKVDCPKDLDCKPTAPCIDPVPTDPEISYLAKDYSSFRQLILDRLALIMPQWQERHIPDIGIALTEVLAYVGDYLSYYQDAVATEAYLGTARQRISVRRHARLVDYQLHEGCNARAWVCLKTDTDLVDLDPQGLYFVASRSPALQNLGVMLTEENLSAVNASDYEVFEPATDATIAVYRGHNSIHLYTWGDEECCLAKGATSATLAGQLHGAATTSPSQPTEHSAPPVLHLRVGDLVVFEEIMGPKTGKAGDADPSHRHVVRLTEVLADSDPLNHYPLVHIRWADADQLPFALCISALGPPPACTMLRNISVVCGNVVLVDHGKTAGEDLGQVPEGTAPLCCHGEGQPADQALIPARFRPVLSRGPLTHRQPVDTELPASKSLHQEVYLALPVIRLYSNGAAPGQQTWQPVADLLASGPEDRHFVAEMDDNGRAHLRFGDDTLGEQPDANLAFDATFRIGNGSAGNVGAGAINRLVFRNSAPDGVTLQLRNPLPAAGGTDRQSKDQAKLYAPFQFRRQLQRAVTAADYVAITEREFPQQIQRAAARLLWTGAVYQVQLAIDPRDQDTASTELLETVRKRLHRYRLMGHLLNVQSAQPVALDIALKVCVAPPYLRAQIRERLLQLLSNRTLADGSLGFFHPDRLSFGDGIYLSHLVAEVQAVTGVQTVEVVRLRRLFEPPNQEIENGVLPLGPFEIARLDNDPSLPENGRLQLDLRGGR